jgi:hypothetical protein
MRHRVAKHAGGNRMALGVVGIQQARRRDTLEHLRQLPSQIHRILHADVQTLSTHRGCTCAASPGNRTRLSRYAAAWRVMSVNLEIDVGLWTP